jgi:hypothetical protein
MSQTDLLKEKLDEQNYLYKKVLHERLNQRLFEAVKEIRMNTSVLIRGTKKIYEELAKSIRESDIEESKKEEMITRAKKDSDRFVESFQDIFKCSLKKHYSMLK